MRRALTHLILLLAPPAFAQSAAEKLYLATRDVGVP